MSTTTPTTQSSSTNAKKPEPEPKPRDAIEGITGAFGRYHTMLCGVIFISKFIIAFHQLAIIFLAPRAKYICPDTKNETCPCENPEFDRSVFTNTIIMQWNLICEQRWAGSSFSQTIFQLGTLMGSVLFGMASDRYGRKKPFCVAVVAQLLFGVLAAFVPYFWLFSICRYIIGLTVGGTMVVGFVIMMEFVGTRHREVMSAVYQTPFNMGHMLTPLIAYFLRDYKSFQLGASIPAALMLCYFWLIPETPRWLIATKRTEKALKILHHVAKVNKRPTENIDSIVEAYQAEVSKNALKKGTILDLFKTPNLRKNILAMSYNWFTCSYCFYGVSQYVGQLSGNIFVNVAASASVTLLGTIASIPLMKYLDRKTILIVFNALTGITLILVAALPAGSFSVVCACAGVVSAFIVFVVVYLHCSEMFPTVLRNAAIGFSSMLARVGSMIAPFVIELHLVAVWLPPLIFAIVPLIAAVTTLFLPETKGCELTNTIEEGERFGRKNKNSSAHK